MFARILALILAVGYLLLATPAFAQTSATSTVLSASPSALPSSNLQSQYPSSNLQLPTSIPPTSPLYTDLLVNNMFHTFSCLAIGQSMIGQPCLTYQMTKNAQGIIQGVPVLSQTNLSGGALGATTSLLVALYQNPPVKTGDYLASIGNGLGIIKETHAQTVGGSGAAILNPILTLWQVSRNISYVAIIIIFLVIGLMVMFRSKLNPQTVISAQAALPGLVIGLILITFSYFLAGLISDMAFVGTNVVGYYFQAAQGQGPQDLVKDIDDKSVLRLFSSLIPSDRVPTQTSSNINYIEHVLAVIMDNSPPEVADFIRFAAGVMAFQYGEQIGHIVPVIGSLVAILTGTIATAAAMADVPFLGGLILSWIAMVVMIYSMLKLLFNLIKTYLTIVFLTITAPFQLLAAALPGRQGMATNWMLNMLAHVLAFPAVLAVLYFIAYLLKVNKPPFNILQQAAISGQNTFPLLGGLDSGFINYLVAFAALTILPGIPGVISRSIGQAGAAGQLLGQEFSSNLQGGRGYSNQWQQFAGGIQKIGANYNEFRGRPPGWSPASDLEGRGASFFGQRFIQPTSETINKMDEKDWRRRLYGFIRARETPKPKG